MLSFLNIKIFKNAFNKTRGESGNVLFLILIAVALFAALSYAVTQSTRGGGGSSDSETTLINSAQITQYPASVRTAVVRMIIAGVAIDTLEFNPPADFDDCSGAPATHSFCVFHPDGGGATYVQAPNTLMVSGTPGIWHFNGEFEIVDVGTSSAGSFDGNEIMAFLPGITSTLCDRINKELGISGDTQTNTNATSSYTADMDDTYALPTTEFVLGDADTIALQGQPFGCFRNQSGDYVYYHVLLEQ